MPDSDSKASKIGGFELLGRLGKGGMGTVLKARQVSMDRLVALKILPKKLAENEQFVQRFLREARSAAKLRHPNIVQAFDVGQAEGYYFFAMEFVDGETLDAVVRRDGPLEPNRALDVMRQTASALAAAHEAGIVHRDIKPSNIMIDKKDEVRVTDFGLAKRTEGDVAVTADGAVVGTPAYVAPEMAKGGEADHRSDLYSLGATIFCALAGRPPFEGRNFSEVLVKHATEPAPPLASLAPRVDRRLCHIIDRLLRKNPEARYPSATALIEDLNGLGKLQSVAAAARAEGRAMIAEAPTLAMTEGKRLERHARVEAQRPRSNRTTLIAVGAVVALLAIVGIIMALRPSRKPPETATSVPDNRKDLTAKTPEDAKKTVVEDTAAKLKAELAEKERIAKAKEEILAKARQQGEELLKQADAAIAAKDFDKARAAIKSLEALDLADFTDEARKKLAEIASREKSAAEWAKWDALKAEAKKLLDAGKLDEAAKLLDGAKALPLDGITGLIAEQMESIESARLKAAAAALAAYQAESDKLWALFKERKYPEAEKLLGNLPQVANLREVMAADLEAAKLLKEFWSAVERGVLARKGKFVSIAGRGGNVEKVKGGQVTLKVGEKEFAAPLLGMDAAQAAAIADLKDDERGNLAKALFLIADGTDADAAGKALAAAGNPPGLATYKDRLAALTLGPEGVAARRAWQEVEAAAKPKLTKADAQRLLGLLAAFDKASAGTNMAAAVRAKADALRAQAEDLLRPKAYALQFDGKDAEVVIPYADEYDFTHAVTVEVKALIPAEPDSPRNTIVSNLVKRPAGTLGFHHGTFMLDHNGAQRISFTLVCDVGGGRTGGRSLVCDLGDRRPGAVQLPQGRWYDFAGQYDGGVIRVYVDGEKRNESVLDARLHAEKSAIRIGAGLNEGTAFKGLVRELRLWKVARTEHEILASRDRKLRGDEPGLVGYWDFSEGEGDVLHDRSAVGNHGAIKGAKWVTLDERPPTPRAVVEAGPGEWQSLFDGKTLTGWKPLSSAHFTGKDLVSVSEGSIELRGEGSAAGVTYTGSVPRMDYEIQFEAMRVKGGGRMAALVFPYGDAHALWALGFHSGSVGIDMVDNRNDNNWRNPTYKRVEIRSGAWHRWRLSVTRERIQGWLDDKVVLNLATAGHPLSIAGEFAVGAPLALCADQDSAGRIRNIRLRRIEPGAAEAPEAGVWQSLFDGKTLEGWRKYEAAGQNTGTLDAKNGQIVLGAGNPHAGLIWTQDFPKCDYELELKVSDLGGYQTPCQLTFPIQDSFCTLFYRCGTAASLSKVGGKDHGVPGGKPGAEKRWYALRLRVTQAKIGVWVDGKQVLDVAIPEGATITCDKADWGIKRLNIRTWKTTAAYRDLRVRRLGPE
ncbi:MAG TPA: protein kinase [Planctomycetota bacterium]|nr:protein kinase [Planctomycetota bacterium]